MNTSSIQIYDGELVFNDRGRNRYMFNGVPVPGVTTILGNVAKPQLIPWAARMASEHFLACVQGGRTDYDVIAEESKKAHDKRLKDAGSIGTNVHNYAEAHFKGQALPELETDSAKRGVEAFLKWLDAHKVVVKASERLVFSKEHHYAGTCDFVAEVDGVLTVGDIKTGSGIYHDHRFQVAAYQNAMQEEKGMTFDARLIVRFDKVTGEFDAKTFHDFDLDFQGFRAALTLHRTLKAMKAG